MRMGQRVRPKPKARTDGQLRRCVRRAAVAWVGQVRLVTIDRGGVLLAGYERAFIGEGRRGSDMQFRQVWWCLPNLASR